ncbi:MAG: endolytic transglycosylase MltG, partial [Chloroflexota bacterium]
NTYLNEGLPPTPIANPGVEAIRAAIFPAETSYLFFRAVCDTSGYHEFAVTYEEHLNNGCTG